MASAGTGQDLSGDFVEAKEAKEDKALVLRMTNGAEAVFQLIREGRSLEICYRVKDTGDVSVLGDALAVTDTEKGYLVVPCREGLLVPADSGTPFTRTFGTSDYEGCQMNMLGLAKSGSTLTVDWDDAYTFLEVMSVLPEDGLVRQRPTTTFRLRRTARTVRLTPLGKGDWNTIATGYRLIAEQKGPHASLRAPRFQVDDAPVLQDACLQPFADQTSHDVVPCPDLIRAGRKEVTC